MNAKTEGTITIVAALFVLLSAMWDASVSFVVSVFVLLVLGFYKLVKKGD